MDYSEKPKVLCRAIGDVEKQKVLQSVLIVNEWASNSGLYATKRLVAGRSYVHHKHMGLFYLFMNNTFVEFVRQWTSKKMTATCVK